MKEGLLQDIFSGRYPSDSRIVETQVARELGTSQAPVREVLRGLEALGIVRIEPHRGARVRRPTIDELLEGDVVRAELEALGARLGIPRMTDTDLAELEELQARMQGAANASDRHEVAVMDAAFHARLVRLAGNATLDHVWQSLQPFSRTWVTLVAPGADAHWTADLHPPILEAIRSRDPERVMEALRRHFDLARAHLAEGLAVMGREPGVPDPAGRASRPTG